MGSPGTTRRYRCRACTARSAGTARAGARRFAAWPASIPGPGSRPARCVAAGDRASRRPGGARCAVRLGRPGRWSCRCSCAPVGRASRRSPLSSRRTRGSATHIAAFAVPATGWPGWPAGPEPGPAACAVPGGTVRPRRPLRRRRCGRNRVCDRRRCGTGPDAGAATMRWLLRGRTSRPRRCRPTRRLPR
ncbi:hypothetical protein D3C72_1140270 [compost metagenome]